MESVQLRMSGVVRVSKCVDDTKIKDNAQLRKK